MAVGWVALMGLGVLAIFAFDAAVGEPVPVAVAGGIAIITFIAASLTVLGVRPDPQLPRIAEGSGLTSVA